MWSGSFTEGDFTDGDFVTEEVLVVEVGLVVDDDAHTRKLRTLILEQYGYEPIVACDGNQALEMLDK